PHPHLAEARREIVRRQRDVTRRRRPFHLGFDLGTRDRNHIPRPHRLLWARATRSRRADCADLIPAFVLSLCRTLNIRAVQPYSIAAPKLSSCRRAGKPATPRLERPDPGEDVQGAVAPR